MRLTYIGPVLPGHDHPVLEELNARRLPPSCYLVEVGEDAGVDGEIIEGDVLVIDEARPVQHGDLVVVQGEDSLRLCRSHRVGGRFRLMRTSGPKESFFARQPDCRGVVINLKRSAAF
ncbi:hypothetical protein [Halomonas sp. SL1]|uniref:hypothetical protein n=1 Tax=Halomonas sp. SL1 TaxID=2137478 RepID=UPI000D15FF1A|nr:hypothetical protein [Halomonas sp. SL1]RAH37538.1 hypothetical protein C9J49_011625 [Halomonas sp. SL1]